ncbi:MAG: hypothetical protein JJT78_13770 [Leptospira sp.]|nr:hypothetical protein [Leptospira sp.]
MPAVEDRVDHLEIALQNFIHSVGIEFNKAYNSNEEFKLEMKEFKDEMREFKDEMKEFKDEMREFKDEMKEFKDEMRGFKDEMKEFKNEVQLNIKDLNKKFGDMSRKLGTIVEDLVLPSMPRIIREKFDYELEEFSINIKMKKDGRNQEFDAIGIYKNFVFLNSTKTTIRESDVSQLQQLIEVFPTWFPQHKGKKIYGILAGFDVSDSIIQLCERPDFLVMGVGGDLMELVNSKDFMPNGKRIA